MSGRVQPPPRTGEIAPLGWAKTDTAAAAAAASIAAAHGRAGRRPATRRPWRRCRFWITQDEPASQSSQTEPPRED